MDVINQRESEKSLDQHANVPTDGYGKYLQWEFVAMDTDKNGKLTLQQLEKLLTFLGYDGVEKPEKILQHLKIKCDDGITKEEYCKAMTEFSDLKTKTNRLRVLFYKFDHNYDGFAPKKDVVEDLKKMMGVKDDKEIIAKVDKMDVNKDGKISYQEFVVTHLKQKKYI